MSRENRPCLAPPTTTYQGLTTSYSAAQSFNIPAHCDSGLLTPVSASSSPLLQNLTKFHRYGTPSTPNQQQSPTENMTMYTWPFVSETHSGQPAPSMHQSASSDFVTTGYMPDGRRTPMPPHENYTGSFGVSDSQDYHRSTYYAPQHESDSPKVETPMAMSMHRGVAGAHSSTTTSTMTALPSQHFLSNRGSEPTVCLAQVSGFSTMTRPPRGRAGRGNGTRGGGTRGSGGRGGRGAAARRNSNRSDTTAPILGEWQNCLGETVPPTLKEGVPALERMIYELRWELRNNKGKNMWECIMERIKERTGQRVSSAACLQMRYKRSRSPYIEWLDRDKTILFQAWRECQKDYYGWVLKRFLELGGSPNMDLNEKDIEFKLVTEHRLEEDVYIPRHAENGVGVRRKVRILSEEAVDGSEQDPTHDEAALHGVTHTYFAAPTHGLSDGEVIEQIYRQRGDTPTPSDTPEADGDRVHAGPSHAHDHRRGSEDRMRL